MEVESAAKEKRNGSLSMFGLSLPDLNADKERTDKRQIATSDTIEVL